MTLYAVAVYCEEKKKKYTETHFGVTHVIAISKNEAIGTGITMAEKTWPGCNNYKSVVEEISDAVVMEVSKFEMSDEMKQAILNDIVEKIDNALIEPQPPLKKNIPQDTAFNAGLLKASRIACRVFVEYVEDGGK